jgi:hypothetical protein
MTGTVNSPLYRPAISRGFYGQPISATERAPREAWRGAPASSNVNRSISVRHDNDTHWSCPSLSSRPDRKR